MLRRRQPPAALRPGEAPITPDLAEWPGGIGLPCDALDEAGTFAPAATQELAGMRDRLAGRLVVGGFPAATAALLPRAIARLTAAHPGLKVQLTQAPTPAQLTAVRRGVRWIPVHDDTGGLRRAVWAATTDNPSAAATAMVHALEEEASS
jgi:hypothetical protein